jgi:hypothetical protein
VAATQLGEGQLAGAVNGDKQVNRAFFGMHFGKIHVQVTDGIVLEFLFLFRRLQGGQPADAVALEEAVQGRAGEVGNGFLQGLKAVIERQLRVLAKGRGNGLFRRCEHCRGRFRAHRGIRRGRALTPLGHRFGVNPMAGG